MEKRLTRSAMMFSLGFVFLVGCSAASFFFGLKLGAKETESKYEMKQLNGAANSDATPYQQQDLVSFYHTVFLPYREFQTEWFQSIARVEQGQIGEASSAFKDLSRMAKQKQKEASSYDMRKSPLLATAQANIIRSLGHFSTASDNAAGVKAASNKQLLEAIASDEPYKTAVKESLTAQQAYYYAMQKWSASVNPDIPSEYKAANVIDINEWKRLPLTVKNKLMADQILSRKQLISYYPQDMTSRVDEFIQSGQQSKMKIRSVTAIVDLLINTKAVRSGDFVANQNSLYTNELLPQLPFFSPSAN
ncbi:hypothetical protein [Paenibacillus sp. NPDC058071]|uniref:hypothetical protein n=1 Tax=Paenibacillus sp. NPDC058071 TaxID=3346326 RepID=UPI0036D88769